MIISLTLIMFFGYLGGEGAKKVGLPSLVGMIIVGIILGQYGLNLITESVNMISSDLRKLALVIILLRVGLGLDIKTLRLVGRPAILMCFVPAFFEILGYVILTQLFFSASILESVLLGTVVAAVSPAIIVPRMLALKEQGYPSKIYQTILAGASIDDVIVIILFTSVLSILSNNSINIGYTILSIPIAIIMGTLLGYVIALIISKLQSFLRLNSYTLLLMILVISFTIVKLEPYLSVPTATLIGVVSIGQTLQHQLPKPDVILLTDTSKKLWTLGEIWLFVLVGSLLNISIISPVLVPSLILISLALIFRVLGVLLCYVKSDFTYKERLFCSIAYLPKATVQASIGAIALEKGLAIGNLILSVAVISILFTAPLGAFLIDYCKTKLL